MVSLEALLYLEVIFVEPPNYIFFWSCKLVCVIGFQYKSTGKIWHSGSSSNDFMNIVHNLVLEAQIWKELSSLSLATIELLAMYFCHVALVV